MTVSTSAPVVEEQTLSAIGSSASNSTVSSAVVSADNIQGSFEGTLTRTSISKTVTKTKIITPTHAVIITPQGDAASSSAHTFTTEGEGCDDTSFITVTKTLSPVEVAKGSVTSDLIKTKAIQTGEALTVTVTVTRQRTVSITKTEYVGTSDTVEEAALSTHVPSNFATEVVADEKTVYVTNTAAAVNVSYTIIQYPESTFYSGSAAKFTTTNSTKALGAPTLTASAPPSEESASEGNKSSKDERMSVITSCIIMSVTFMLLFL